MRPSSYRTWPFRLHIGCIRSSVIMLRARAALQRRRRRGGPQGVPRTRAGGPPPVPPHCRSRKMPTSFPTWSPTCSLRSRRCARLHGVNRAYSLLTNKDPPAETRRPSSAGSASASSAAACAGSNHHANAAASARSGTASARSGAASARSAAGSAASASADGYLREEALIEFRFILPVKDVKGRQTDVRDLLLIENNLRAGIVVR
jgi:hypothetical protein